MKHNILIKMLVRFLKYDDPKLLQETEMVDNYYILSNLMNQTTYEL